MNIDLTIVIVFLLVNLVAGLYSGRGIKTIKEYAIGNRDFSTSAIAATIIATWISGSFFTVNISETYKEGLWYAVTGLGDIIALLIIGWVFGPKLKEFFGSLSVAETMGTLYGKNIRIITAIASIAQAVGMTALQIKVFSSIFTHFLSFSSDYATIISSFVVILYSAFGGIKSVTFTDVIQFITFGVCIPILTIFVWKIFGDVDAIRHTFNTHPNFDYRELLNYNNPKFWPYFFLLLYFSVPGFGSTMFQRTLMARDVKQIRQSFTIAAIAAGLIHIFSCFIGFVVLSHDSSLAPNNVAMYVIDNYSFTGLKGLAIVGIMAMVMSTADSWLNAASVIFTHDFCKPLGLTIKNELSFSRFFTVLIGTIAVFLALYSNNLLKLILLQANFYSPVVSVALIAAILGFRTNAKVVIIGMIAGVSSVLIWRSYIQPITGIDSVMPSMFANLVAFIIAYHLLGKPGGWIETQNQIHKKKFKINKVSFSNFKNSFLEKKRNFSFINYCQANTPGYEYIYSYFAFAVLSTLITTFSLDKITYQQHAVAISTLQGVALFISTIFICYKLWPSIIKERYAGIIWYSSIFVSLAYISSFLVLISKFSQTSLVIFIFNLTTIGMLLNWQTTLLMITSGSTLAFISYQAYIGEPELSNELYNLKMNIIYVLFVISSFMLAFLKPKQEEQALIQEKNKHLSDRIDYTEEELGKALELKNEFLRNISHEVRTPMVGITSLGPVLSQMYDQLKPEQVKKYIDDIASNSTRLESLMYNILDLSALTSLSAKLEYKLINLSDLVQERAKVCRKLYLYGKGLELTLNVEDNLVVSCDEYYIKQTIDNLIINAINYGKDSNIIISLRSIGLTRKQDDEEFTEVEFSIQDQGIGIPKEELYDIFGSFIVSSKTHTPAGGRGVGLALCKKVVDLHKGKIWAESDGETGATFIFIIPK